MKKTEETKARIIDVAVKLFNTLGYEKTSMDDIARFANKAKRSLYYHFASKEEIFQNAVEQELAEMQSRLEPLFENKSIQPAELFRDYFEQRMEQLSQSKAYKIVLGYEMSANHTLPYERFRTNLSSFENWEHDHFLEVCSRVGNVPDYDPAALTNMLQMLIKSFDMMFFVQGKYKEYKTTFQLTVNQLTKGMALIINNNQTTIDTKQ